MGASAQHCTGMTNWLRTIQYLANILGGTDFDFGILCFWDVCWFPDFQFPRFPKSKSTARVSSRKYFIPGCVGRGLDLDLRIRPAPAAPGKPSGWAQSGPKWVGPSRAQVGGPKPGPSGWAQAGAQARNLGPNKNPKNKNSQNQNPFCPKCPPGPIWGLPRQFFAWAGKI